MENKEFERLIVKPFENKISEQETDRLEDWLREKERLVYFNRFVEFH